MGKINFHKEGQILSSECIIIIGEEEYRVWYECCGETVTTIGSFMEYDDGYGKVNLTLPENRELLDQVIDLIYEEEGIVKERCEDDEDIFF